MAVTNVYSVTNRTSSQLMLLDSDLNSLSIGPGATIAMSLDTAQYAKAVNTVGAANVTLAQYGTSGVDVAAVPTPSYTGNVVGSLTYASEGGGYVTVPQTVLIAILTELRVISGLLNSDSQNADLMSMRADEVSAAIGSSLN